LGFWLYRFGWLLARVQEISHFTPMKDRGFIRNDILDWAFWLYRFGRLLARVQEISHFTPMKDRGFIRNDVLLLGFF
jgi:hypothetical protein